MTKVMKVSEAVDRIREDVCKDCKQKCGLCEHGVCEDVIIEIGCFFIHVADMEHKEKQ